MPASFHSLFPPYPLEDRRHHEPEFQAAIQRVLDRGNYILGPEVAAFESELAAFLGVNHVIGVASGTDAIELMLRAHHIGPGDAVVVPAMAPSAVAAGVTRSGAEPVLADVEPDTLTLCPASLETILRSNHRHQVKAALAIHLYGHPADWESLQQVAHEHGILLLEDCSQAHGARWQGRMTGTLGAAAAFSFYPTKNLAAVGDAGAVATNDAALAERIHQTRQYGWHRERVSAFPGVNSRLDELQAAVLLVKLKTLEERNLQRRHLAAKYDSALASSMRVTPPAIRRGCEPVYHQYVVRCERRESLLNHLRDAGIPAAVHYDVPLHQQPAFASGERLPESEKAAGTVLSLPLHPYLSDEAVEAVCRFIDEHG